MKQFITTFLSMGILLLSGCSEELTENSGYAPNDLVGKSILANKYNGGIQFDVTHLSETGVLPNTTATVDYGEYAPSYTYTRSGDNQADYYFTYTKKTYIPFYGDYVYGKFVYEVTFSFESETKGRYQGSMINGNMDKSSISGSFKIY